MGGIGRFGYYQCQTHVTPTGKNCSCRSAAAILVCTDPGLIDRLVAGGGSRHCRSTSRRFHMQKGKCPNLQKRENRTPVSRFWLRVDKVKLIPHLERACNL